jgi:hypothetical protein
VSDHASYDETVGYDVRNDNERADQSYPIRLYIIATFFSAEGFSPNAPELSQDAHSSMR